MRNPVRLALGIAAIAAAFTAGPAAARSTTYCTPSPCSTGVAEPSIQAAMDAASGDTALDTIRVGAGTLTAAQVGPLGFASLGVGNPVDVIGAGSAQTILPAPDSVFTLVAFDPASSISALQISLPAAANRNGIDTGGLIHDVVISRVDPTNGFGDVGVRLQDGGTLQDSVIAVPTAFQSFGVRMYGASNVLRSQVSGGMFG